MSCELTVKEILEVIATFETLQAMSLHGNDGKLLCEKYMANQKGQRAKVLQIYVDVKFNETMSILKPLISKNKPEATA